MPEKTEKKTNQQDKVHSLLEYLSKIVPKIMLEGHPQTTPPDTIVEIVNHLIGGFLNEQGMTMMELDHTVIEICLSLPDRKINKGIQLYWAATTELKETPDTNMLRNLILAEPNI